MNIFLYCIFYFSIIPTYTIMGFYLFSMLTADGGACVAIAIVVYCSLLSTVVHCRFSNCIFPRYSLNKKNLPIVWKVLRFRCPRFSLTIKVLSRKNLHQNVGETFGETLSETLGEAFRARQASPWEFRIGLYAWLLTRFSPELVSFTRDCA